MDDVAQNNVAITNDQQKPRKRVRAACERCRRQKLGCDSKLPCAMCLRACVECVAGLRTTPRKPQKQRRANSTSQTERETIFRPEGALNEMAISPSIDDSSPQASKDDGSSMRARRNNENIGDGDGRGFSLRHHTQGTSVIHLTREIFDQFESSPDYENETFAIPGGSDKPRPSPGGERQIPLLETFGLELPPKHVTDFLLQTYLDSVHWFMMVFHEPSFRESYEKIMNTGAAPRRKTGFVVLLMMVLAIGARYATPLAAQNHCPETDLKLLQNLLLNKVKEQMFDVYDDGRLESAQISILLASFYLYHSRPNLAFAVLGAGIKSAQAMGLHRESSWKPSSPIVRETRRRTWWALYVFDRFASIVFGRPCSINDLDCDVAMVQDLDDTSARHPRLHSQEVMDDGTLVPVTIFSYQRFKFRLYRIASPIIGNVYFLRGATKAQVVERVSNIHQELTIWFSSLPEELKLGRTLARPAGILTRIEKTFRLQALALQLAYDNIMILLHRPLLQYNFDSSTRQSNRIANLMPDQPFDESSSPTPRAQSISKNQCWESAMRTSRITDHVDVLRVIKNTHAAAYTGIHMFTAGILLSIVALSQPLSSQAQEAKQAITRVIRLSKALGHQTVLSAQSGKILEGLVKVILAKELKELLSEQALDYEDDEMLATANPTPRPSSPVGGTRGENLQDDRAWLAEPGPNSIQLQQNIYDNSIPGFDSMYDGRSFTATLGNTDFNEGFISLQEVIRNNSHQFMVEETSPPMQGAGHDIRTLNDGTRLNHGGMPPSTNNIDNVGSIFGGSYGGINDSGQTWMWEMDPAPF